MLDLLNLRGYNMTVIGFDSQKLKATHKEFIKASMQFKAMTAYERGKVFDEMSPANGTDGKDFASSVALKSSVF